jgi:hypothetical protein
MPVDDENPNISNPTQIEKRKEKHSIRHFRKVTIGGLTLSVV